jgi:hypothetical protein
MQEEFPSPSRKGRSLKIGLIVLTVLVLGLGGYLVYTKGRSDASKEIKGGNEQAAEEAQPTEQCSAVGDLSVLENSAYPYNKARITSKEGSRGGSVTFPNEVYVLDQPDFVLEGVNLPEADKITVEWDGNGKVEQVGNFKLGDTHWCFEISEAKGNIKKGVNIYMVRIYFTGDEVVEYSVQITWNAFEAAVADSGNIKVDWLPEAKKEPVEKFFTQEERDNFYTDCNNYDYIGGKEVQKPCYDLFAFYRAGSVESGKYKGYDYYLVSRTFIGHGSSEDYYRVLRNPSEGKLILLSKYSNEPAPEDKKFFTVADDAVLDNLLPKAEIPIPGTSYFLERHSESPNALFSYMTDEDGYSGKPRKLFTDAEAGDVYLDEHNQSFMVRVPDGSVMIYRIKLPFAKEREAAKEWNKDNLLLVIKFTDGKENTQRYSHGSRFLFTCMGGELYDVIPAAELKPDTQLELAGTAPTGEKFYRYKERDTLKKFYAGEGFSSKVPYGLREENMSFDQFVALNPLLFWKDPLGRWVRFTVDIFTPLAECGGAMRMSAL